MKLKIFLTPVWESYQVSRQWLAPFWSSEPFTGLEVENNPSPAPVLIGLKILLVLKVGFDVNFISFFSSVTSLTSTLFRRFSIVLPNTELFISLKKSFSNELLA